MKTLTIGMRFEARGTSWLVRGLNKAGKGLYCTESRRSYNRVYFQDSELKALGLKFQSSKPAPKTVQAKSKIAAPAPKIAKAPAPVCKAPEVSRHGFKKSKGLEAKASWIAKASTAFISSYNMTGISLRVSGSDVVQTGGFTAHGKARRTQVYSLVKIAQSKDGVQTAVQCKNSRGDLVIFLRDSRTGEVVLGVQKLGC